jgi:hypothetical protein
MSEDKRVQEIVRQMLQKAGTPNPAILSPDGMPAEGPPDEFQILVGAVQNLEMGMVQIARSQENIGMVLDTARLTMQMLTAMMVEKGLFTQEEIEQRYKTDVADKIIQRQKEMQKQIQAQIAQMQAEAEGAQTEHQGNDQNCTLDCDCKHNCDCYMQPVDEEETAPPEDVEAESDVVLPSERPGNVVRFPSKEKE